MKEDFRFDCSADEACVLLTECYRIEVENRQRTCAMDQDTRGHVLDLARWITDPTDTHYGVMLIGGLGNGKTTLMRALKRAMFYMNRNCSGDYQLEWQMVIRAARSVTADDRFHKCLGIDDLGTEPLERMSYGNIETPTTDVLYHRYEKRLFTVVTTNLALQPNDSGVPTLRQRYGDRLADRFSEMFHIIRFYNQSYR
jgi:DNA replication protein DnaC